MHHSYDDKARMLEPDAIIQLYLKGLNFSQLALNFNRTEQHIRNVLSINGLPLVDNKVPSRKKYGKRFRYSNRK